MEVQPKNIESWVDRAPRVQLEFRRAVHTILLAITRQQGLKDTMVMKGGMLMAIHYDSIRFTKDVDFSSSLEASSVSAAFLEDAFTKGLREVVEVLDYGLDCRLQKCVLQPSNNSKASFPSYEITIGFAQKGTAKHKRLLRGASPSVVSIDFSLNEKIINIDSVSLDEENEIQAYGIYDLIAEKFRSLLQQTSRNRYRRQDVYDLKLLIDRLGNLEGKNEILQSLIEKAESRRLMVNLASLDDPEVKRRAEVEYHTLADEVEGDLPIFDVIFSEVLEFYKNLPWIEHD